MAAVTNADIPINQTEIKIVDRIYEACGACKPLFNQAEDVVILQYHISFADLVGLTPTHSLLLSTTNTSRNPFFHEACVFLPFHDELYVTSNLLQATTTSNSPTILISRIKLFRTNRGRDDNEIDRVEWVKMRPPQGIDMPNGGVNYDSDSIILCSQGSTRSGTGGIIHMPRGADVRPLVTNFHGRDFNSVNDVVVAKDGAIWFTDPCYGHEQDFRPRPKLPCQIYRFVPETGCIRAMADGLGKPNGICFSPDEEIVYVTDTHHSHGDGGRDLTRSASIYAYDVVEYAGGPFLANKRLFAFAVHGVPDGIKCDVYGNVYAGCGDGVEVWNPAGTLIGTIVIPGGVANFCFGKGGEMFLCNEQKIWRVQLARETKGALLRI